MGYRIDYQHIKKLRHAEKKNSRLLALSGIFFLLILLLIQVFWPEGSQILKDLLIPGDNAVTAAALETLCADLKNNKSVSDAFTTFCRRIIFP